MADTSTPDPLAERALIMASSLFALALVLSVAGTWVLAGVGSALIAGSVLLLAATAWFLHVASTRTPR